MISIQTSANIPKEEAAMQVSERVVYADFLHMKERPDVCPASVSIPLGEREHNPDLAKLHEGEAVLLADPGSFHAKGHIHIVERNGTQWYYGILDEPAQDDTGDQTYTFYA
jgi:hypothetical protein